MWKKEYNLLKRHIRPASWRFTVGAGAGIAASVLLVNLIFLIWSASSLNRQNGVATAYSGSCGTAKTAALWLHLAINVLSTVLLGASNNCAQLLSSPSRDDVDRAHGKGKWMTIGAPSVRNLAFIPAWRTALWTALYASSVPIHVLYNSTVFNTISANAYQVAMASGFYANGTAIDWGPKTDPLHNVEKYQRLEKGQCVGVYSHTFLSEWGDLLLVTDWAELLLVTGKVSNATTTIQNTWLAVPGQPGIDWTCRNTTTGKSHSCNFDKDGEPPPGLDVLANGHRFQYCLAERMQPHCKVEVAVSLLSVVVICNFVKVVCLTTAVFAWKFEPLATVGDAISLFMSDPDSTTEGLGLLSAHEIHRKRCQERHERRCSSRRAPSDHSPDRKAESSVAHTRRHFSSDAVPTTYDRRRWRWYDANALHGWWQFQLVASGLLLTMLVFSSLYSSGIQDGFGTVSTDRILPASADWSLLSIVLVVNLAQLFLSLFYLLANKLLTEWLTAHEYSKFASVRRPLRVSKPQGEQRTSYYLQLPYRYVLPFLTAMATAHWTMSRSLFLVDMTVHEVALVADGSRKASNTQAVGYSPQAIMVTFCILLAIIVVLEGLGFRKLDPGMPIIGLCSASISAASHLPDDEGGDAPMLPLMYGVMPQVQVGEHGCQRVGFSSQEVMPLVDGMAYI